MNQEKIIESLSPIEKRIIPHLKDNSIDKISKETNLDQIAIIRSLEYLKNKEIIKLDQIKTNLVEVGVNGARYKKNGLPERVLLNLLRENRIIGFEEAQKKTKLSDDEFKASLGVLKKKLLIEINNKKIFLNANLQEISKKMPEESLLDVLPIEKEKLQPEQLFALKNLEKRKDIIQSLEKKEINFQLTDLGKKISSMKLDSENLIESITPELLKKDSWKNKKFRRYDLTSNIPEINGGKRHFVNQSIEYAKKIWTDMGFKEMTGNMAVSSFWNFDALFTAQDHPVRELQDTFYLDQQEKLPEKELVEKVKKAHEEGVGGSRGWQYNWDKKDAEKMVLRTHTTCLSAQTLSQLKKEDLPAKFFALGKCFRNETVDWSHGFEFYQTEGIVVDENANFRHLLGYLTQFYKKMGFEKIRFSPAYFPYTEPSVEINVFHPERKVWIELGGAGIFRPELTIPLLGKQIPVLAWGQGLDRILMDYFKIKDLRELYKNNITQLRKMKFWIK